MRAKVVVTVLLCAAGLLTVAALLSKLPWHGTEAARLTDRSVASDGAVESDSEAQLAQVKSSQSPVPLVVAVQSITTVTNTPGTAASETTDDQDYIERRIEELQDLGMKRDSASRDVIVLELQNSNKEIRKAALEAAIQFGDRSLTPLLKQLAEQTDDPEEKSSLVEAADYISLPSFSEYRARQKAGLAGADGAGTSPVQNPADSPSNQSSTSQ